MPYLSEILINPLRSGGRELLANPQRIHAAVEASLPPDRVGEGRLLWRLEQEPGRTRLLVQSPDRPTFDHIVEQAGWRDNPQGAPRLADLGPLLAQVGRGRQYSFRMRLNPVTSTRRPAGLQKPTPSQVAAGDRGSVVRVAERTAAHQMEWFLQRAWTEDRWGFRVVPDTGGLPNARLAARDTQTFKHGEQRITIQTATYDGVLEITDADGFRSNLLCGVGKGKAYGCGLITLAPAV